MSIDFLSKYEFQPKDIRDFYLKNELFDDQSLYELLTLSVNLNPDKIVILNSENQAITYTQLFNQVQVAATAMSNKGIKLNDVVIIQIEILLDFIIALFACLRIGAIPLLALPAHRSRELLHLIEVSSAKYFISEQLFYNSSLNKKMIDKLIHQSNIELLIINQLETDLINKTLAPYELIKKNISTENPALMLVSGGTTGLPKVIARSHEDYRYNVYCAIKKCLLTCEDIYMVILPAAHNFPLSCPGILGIIASGGQLVYCNNSSPEHAFALIETFKVTITSIVPSIANIWAQATKWEKFNFSSIRLIQVGGSRFSINNAQFFDNVFNKKLQQVYGMAEGLVCFTDINLPRKFIWATQGSPMSKFDDLLVIDCFGNALKNGEEGELLVKGPYTIRGYYNAKNINQQSFSTDGYYCTGDKVKILKSGDVIVTGRIKDCIIRAGENIDCIEIEEIITKHPDILDAILIGKTDEILGEKTCLIIIPLTTEKIPSYAEIRDFFIQQKIALFKIPDEIAIEKEFPKTAVGKIDRKKLSQKLN